jgi:uncharacterized protein
MRRTIDPKLSPGAGDVPVLERPSSARALGAEWDALLGPGDLYLDTRWLEMVEFAYTAPPLYLVARGRTGAIEGGLVGYRFDATTPASSFYRIDMVLARLIGDAGHPSRTGAETFEALLPSLFCGGRTNAHSRVPVAPSLDSSSARRVTGQLLLGLEEQAEATGAASLGFLYVDADDLPLRGALEDAGYRCLRTGVRSILDVAWSSFVGYERGFSRNRRFSIRRERRMLAEAGVRYRIVRLSDELAPVLAPLELALHRKHGSSRTLDEAESALRFLARAHPDGTSVILASAGSRVVGFVVLVRWWDELYLRQLGLDYEWKGDLPLYFALVFYEPIQMALRWGVVRIEYSIEAEETKASRGCRQVEQLGYVKALSDPAARVLDAVLPAPGEGPGPRGGAKGRRC